MKWRTPLMNITASSAKAGFRTTALTYPGIEGSVQRMGEIGLYMKVK